MTNHKPLVPNAESSLDTMKYEVAEEVGVPLKHGDNGDLTARQAGKVGGNMVKKLIEKAEHDLSQ